MTDSQTTAVTTAEPALFTHDGYRLYVFDGEPRIMDVDIGKRIGRKKATNIRTMIEENLKDIEFYGLVRLVSAPIPQGGRPRQNQGRHRTISTRSRSAGSSSNRARRRARNSPARSWPS